jgi:hypothetical protein
MTKSAAPDVYQPRSDVAADQAVTADVARLRTLLRRQAIDWAEATAVWQQGPDRIADVPEPVQRVDDALANRAGEPDDVRRTRALHGLDVIIAVRIREELAEADAAMSTSGDGAAHDIDQARVYSQAAPALAAIETLPAALGDGRAAAEEGDQAAFAAAAARIERALEAFFYAAALDALERDTSEAVRVAASETLYTAIAERVRSELPDRHDAVVSAFADADADGLVVRRILGHADLHRMFGE